MAKNVVQTLPRWIYLAGISFFGLIAASLSALFLACSSALLSLSLFAVGEISIDRARVSCAIAGPASTIIEKSPILRITSSGNELGQISSTLRSAAILIQSTCVFLSDYSGLEAAISDEGRISEQDGETLRLAVGKLINGVESAFEIVDRSARTEEAMPILKPYRNTIEILSRQGQSLKRVIPLFLHAQALREDEHWFIGFQNLAEARSTGGMISNYAILRLGTNGWQIVESGTNLDLLASVPLVIPDRYKPVFGVIGANSGDWRDLNSLSDNDLILESIQDSWNSKAPYQLDGALFAGQGLAAQLVAATGDIQWRGTFMDAKAFFEFLSGDFYEFESDKEARTRDLAIIFDQAVNGLKLGELSLTRLAGYLAESTDGDWLQVYPSSPGLARALESSKVQPSYPRVDISFNNVGANKLDRYSFVSATICSQPELKDLSVTVEFENRSPRSGLPPHVSPLYTDEKGNAVPQGTARIQLMIRIPNTLNLTDFESSSGLEAFPVLEFDTGQVFVLETVIPPGGKISHVLGIQSNLPIEGFDIQFSPMLNRPEITHRDSDCSSPAGGN